MDEFGPLNLQPRPGRQWTDRGGKHKNRVEIACTPTNSSWLNRIEAQFTALRRSALDGTGHRIMREEDDGSSGASRPKVAP
jgi:transposase